MALFSLTDIKFLSSDNRGSNLTDFSLNNKRYPIDLGSTDKGHYIMFYIFTQNRTQVGQTSQTNTSQNFQNIATDPNTNIGAEGQDVQESVSGTYSSTVDDSILGKVFREELSQTTKDVFNTLLSSTPGPDQNLLAKGNFFRTITKTKDTIALYMPDTLRFTYGQSYRPLELGSGALAAGAAFASSAYNTVKSNDGNNVSNFMLNIGAGLSGQPILKALATAATGLVNNPMLEVIYSSPRFREFSFNFMLYPRSEKEAIDVQNILSRFRFHQAPEIKDNTGGFFLIPPSEFDISFMYNGRPNPNIDKISTCVLTNISVDYAPKGFQAYEVGGENDAKLGRTGMPIGIGLSLTFMETQILTKEYHDNYSRTLGQASVVNSINNEFALNEAGRVKDNTGSE